MKPRIFIAIHYLEIGGAETSLIGLLEALDPGTVDVDLFVYAHHGLFMKAIPEYVNLLPENEAWSMFEEPLSKVVKKGYWRIALARLIAIYKTKQYYETHHSEQEHNAAFSYVGREVAKAVPSLKHLGQYDLAISYVNPHDFVLKQVDAMKKICWIHTDYSRISIDAETELPVWGGYDKIVSISPDVTKSFLSVFPTLKGKILEMENILPKSYILQRASELNGEVSGLMNGNVVNLCSIGRISNAKNYDNVPYMAKALKELFNLNFNANSSINHGFDKLATSASSTINHFHWYIVGPGDHTAIDALSKELGVDDVVTFLGPSSNPYPYIKACDIYVHPSRYEGKSIVVREAQILCKPVIITNYPTAKSQINDGVDGIICELDNKKIAEAIYDLAIDKAKQKQIIDYLKAHDFAGINAVDKIYKLIDE